MKCPYCNKRIIKTINQCPHCKRSIDNTNIEVVEIQDGATIHNKKDNFFKRLFASYVTFWTKYIDYTSTTGVFDFWASYSIHVIIFAILSLLWWWLAIPYGLAIVVPLFTMIMRRFNDVGFPLMFLVVALIPVGVIAVLIMCCLKKDFYRNKTDLHD